MLGSITAVEQSNAYHWLWSTQVPGYYTPPVVYHQSFVFFSTNGQQQQQQQQQARLFLYAITSSIVAQPKLQPTVVVVVPTRYTAAVRAVICRVQMTFLPNETTNRYGAITADSHVTIPTINMTHSPMARRLCSETTLSGLLWNVEHMMSKELKQDASWLTTRHRVIERCVYIITIHVLIRKIFVPYNTPL